MGLSPQQQAAISGLDADALITAGAGTGKTRTLTARYLQLLADGVPLRSIVAITFTRKAAREMRNRIREQVWDYLARPELSEAERAQWRSIAIQLDAARISTFHGLCREILQTHPAEARVDPYFQTLEESKTSLLQEESVDDALVWAAGQERVADLLAAVDEKTVRRGVKTLLSRGSEARAILQALPDDPSTLRSVWEAWLLAQQTRRWQELLADPDWRQACDIIAVAAPTDSSDKLAGQRALAVEALAMVDVGGEAGAFRRAAQLLLALDLRGGRAAAWPDGKAQVAAIKSALKRLRSPFKKDKNIPGSGADAWLGETLNDQDARVALALVQLKAIALQAMRFYEAKKADLQALDFDDLEHRAIQLLAEQAPVRAWWQSQVQALLVDEFQDTNARQAHLLEMLNGGRGRLFLVGDAKQSIYRFRGADVAVFQDVRQAFAAAGKRVAPLDETWRAHPALVDALNDLLGPVLGEARHPWEAPFESLHPARPDGPLCPGPHFIEFYLAAGKRSDGAMERAALATAWRLRELLAAGVCKADDVAILCRTASSFSFYEDALDAAGIPFLTLAGRGFYQRPEIRDLVIVMRAAADPTDDVALAGALRSPGLGLSDVALYQLARQRQASLWDALISAPEALVEVERPRAERARRLIGRLHNMAGRVTVADLLKRYVDDTDYLAILLAAGQARAARNVAKLMADIQQAGFVQVEAFIDYVKLARAVNVREGEAPVVAEGAVQIMTVHRAKGLEFPIVALGDISRQPRGRDGLLVVAGQVGWQLPLPPGEKQRAVFYEALKRQESRKEEAEEKRLLYVAATRAQDYLLLSGVADDKGWLHLLARAISLDENCFDKEADETVQSAYTLPISSAPALCTLIGADWTPVDPMAVKQTAKVRTPLFYPDMLAKIAIEEDDLDEKGKAAETKPEQRVWRVLAPPEEKRAWAPAWVVGALIHRAIEIERFPDDPRFDAWLRASARGLGLSDERMLSDALRRARRVLSHFQKSAFWQELLSADLRLHEIPYAYTPADVRIDRGAIDIAWRQDGRWHLADFKTDRVQNREEMLARIEEKGYREQVQRYIRAMTAIWGEPPVAYLCFLDVAGEMATIVVE